MEPSRPRRKAANQASSFQPSKSSKDKNSSPKENDLSLEKQTEKEQLSENISEPQATNKQPQSPEKNTKQTENTSDAPTTQENPNAMLIEEPTKPANLKSREILYGDDAPEEIKKQIESLFENAQSFASKEDYKQAINIYNKIVKLNSKSTAAFIAMGHCFAMLEDNYQALQSYQQALAITPDSQKDDQLWFGIGLLYQKIEDWKNAETSFKNALKLNPSTNLKGEILYHLGVIMKVRGDYQEGIKMLTNSILLGSYPVAKMIDILCHIGTGLEELNEMNEAMQTYKYALMLDENNYRALQCTGWLYFQTDKVNDALEHLNKAALLNDDDHNTSYMKARCFLKLSQHNKAYESLHKCITKDSSNSVTWCSLGILFSELTQLKSAHECFSNALKFNSKSPENFFNMGCLFELSSQPNDAILMYDKALELQPNFQLAQNRKQLVVAQTENKTNNPLEVQFKHHKFTLSFLKDIDKEKPLFFFPQIIQQTALRNNSDNANLNSTVTLAPLAETRQEEAHANNTAAQTSSTASIPSLQPVIPQIAGTTPSNSVSSQASAKLFGTPSTTPKGAQSDINLLSKQLIPGSGNVVSPLAQGGSFLSNRPLQTLKQNINVPNPLGSFSLLNTQKNNSNPPAGTGAGEPMRIEETKTSVPDKTDKKSSSGFQTTSGKNKTSPSEISSEQGQSSFKINRNLTSPIVLRHDPHVVNKEEAQQQKNHEAAKPQKTGFKLTQKGNRGEEGLIPQKKIKG